MGGCNEGGRLVSMAAVGRSAEAGRRDHLQRLGLSVIASGAKQSRAPRDALDCFAPLAMTARESAPLWPVCPITAPWAARQPWAAGGAWRACGAGVGARARARPGP